MNERGNVRMHAPIARCLGVAAAAEAIGALLFVPGALAYTQGDLDPSFGVGGKVVKNLTPAGIPPGQINDVARGVAIDSAGRIVIAGAAGNDFAVLRYQPDGSLDSSFGTGGVVETDFSAGIDRASAITIQSNGDIVA